MPSLWLEKLFKFVLTPFFQPKKEQLVYFLPDEVIQKIKELIKVTSPEFEQDQPIPWKYGGETVGEDVTHLRCSR